VAIRMQSFEMRTIGFDPIIPAEESAKFGVESLSLEEIWPQADYITVHTPLIPQTKNLINAQTLAKCKKGVRIINVARGGIVDENALLEGLKSGHVAGAGLDVFIEEPPLNTALVQHPKVVCTPHLGASTKEAQNNVAKEIALQFLDIIDGKAVPGVVNAPLLSQMLKHENIIWTRLGQDLGKLAATHAPKLKSLKVIVSGRAASAAVKLIKESVLVGALSVLANRPVNIIAAAGVAENLAISANFEVSSEKPCCRNNLTIETDVGTSYKACAQGEHAYLVSLNGHSFEPTVVLDGHLTLFESKDDAVTVLTQLAKNNPNQVRSTNQSGNLWAVHSTGKLQLGSLSPTSLTYAQFH